MTPGSPVNDAERVERVARGRHGRLGRLISTTLAAALVLEVTAAPLTARIARAEGPAAGAPAQTVEQLASQAYEQTSTGKYSEAIATYMKAFEISRAAAVLYNIAAIYDRKLHERSLAMEYFRRYLQAPDADPEFARKATERLSALKAETATEEKTRASMQVATLPPPAPPPPAEPPPDTVSKSDGTGLRIAGFVVGAVGLVGVGTGLGLGALAKSKYDSATSNKYCGATSCTNPQGVTLDNQASSFATASTVTVIAGAVFLAAGITFVLVAPHGHSSSSAMLTLAPQVTPTPGGGGGLSLQGRF
jgi:tetratricopeptide (TPR) repeat protein